MQKFLQRVICCQRQPHHFIYAQHQFLLIRRHRFLANSQQTTLSYPRMTSKNASIEEVHCGKFLLECTVKYATIRSSSSVGLRAVHLMLTALKYCVEYD